MAEAQLYWGDTPVPWTVSWTGEDRVFLGTCPHAGALAIRQDQARGIGKPRFGAPHMDRQRAAIALCLCDLCGRPLRDRTKVSLSQARSQTHAARPLDVLQVEPMPHRTCAARCLDLCPSLRRQRAEGGLFIRQVLRHRVQFAIYSEAGVEAAVGVRKRAISHAKVQLVDWRDRDLAWLLRPGRVA